LTYTYKNKKVTLSQIKSEIAQEAQFNFEANKAVRLIQDHISKFGDCCVQQILSNIQILSNTS
jgi:hypothetical protein